MLTRRPSASAALISVDVDLGAQGLADGGLHIHAAQRTARWASMKADPKATAMAALSNESRARPRDVGKAGGRIADRRQRMSCHADRGAPRPKM
jgi:hypothetical protein